MDDTVTPAADAAGAAASSVAAAGAGERLAKGVLPEAEGGLVGTGATLEPGITRCPAKRAAPPGGAHPPHQRVSPSRAVDAGAGGPAGPGPAGPGPAGPDSALPPPTPGGTGRSHGSEARWVNVGASSAAADGGGSTNGRCGGSTVANGGVAPTGEGGEGDGEAALMATSPGGLRVRTPEDEEMEDGGGPTDMEADGIDNAADVARYAGIGGSTEPPPP